MTTLDEADLKVLSHLQESQYLDINYKRLAQDLKLAESQVRASVTQLEERGVICGRTVVIDAEKLGFITVFIRFKCHEALDKTLPKVTRLKASGRSKGFTIQEVFLITGDMDVHLKVKVRGLDGYSEFVREFEGSIERIGLALASGTIGYEKQHEQLTLDAV